ncbi:MAG: Rne/Rng family ribonuclease [Terracidiphilus sp.]|jgi:ribonuclease G
MAKEICISSTPHETRLAILEDDQLAEIYYERENEYTLAGSIYNGRVTRVLPGMQSAFVDVGLERDAFLYVTDFMELEDPEETDEIEKAAISGANQPPREVRHTAAAENNGGRSGRSGQKPDQKPEQRQEPRAAQERQPQERPAADGRRLTVEALPDAGLASLPVSGSLSFSEPADSGEEDSGEPGAKRWRGRRRRRGGRGSSGSQQGSQSETSSTPTPAIEQGAGAEPEIASQIQASVGSGDRSSSQAWSAPAHSSPSSDRAAGSSTPFVMPGESLSKYGGAPGDDAPKTESAATPARPQSAFKPTTMIQSPIQWDGSGLMPGESLSKHRKHEPDQPAIETHAEPQNMVGEAAETSLAEPETSFAPDAIEEQDFFEETTEAEPVLLASGLITENDQEIFEKEIVSQWTKASLADEASAEIEPLEDEFEETSETADVPMAASQASDAEASEPEPDASASHSVDPIAPTGFRLFGLGKKKTEEKAAKPEVKSASSYAPGSGLIVEETIEEEEFDAPRHHRHAKSEDQDDFEEETLPNQLRTGDLGEMLQEAHLDHRIQLNFDEKTGDGEGFDDEDDEEPTAEGQPAAGAAGQQRRDHSARGGRHGRGGQAASGGPAGKGRGMSRRSMQTSDLPIISDLLKPGQEILVQIAKEPIAKKGARITSHIALPGRFLVFMPTVSHIGVSRKIASDEERQRLKRILVHERGEASGGFIVRTAAEGASEEDLRADLRFLLHLWAEIKQRSDDSKSPALIYHDLSLIERILRDQVSSNFSSIWVDSEANYERIVRFLNRFSPTLVRRVKLYTKETPLFEHFGIQDEIAKALCSKVWLKSGGSIVINQTEALVAIDINTGKYVGKSARLEDTIVKTNLDAVPEIVRQIRLRDLGGIIVIDFIDMDDRKNRFRVMAALEEALKSDRAPTKVLQFNDFGLVAITRKRVKQSLERTLSVPCPTCQATGMVKSPTTVCNEIYTELRKMKKHFESADVLLRVNPETVKVLKSNNSSWLTEYEELIGKNILVKSDATLHPEQFDIQG